MKKIKGITIVIWVLLLCTTLGYSLLHTPSMNYAEKTMAAEIERNSTIYYRDQNGEITINPSAQEGSINENALYGDSERLANDMMRISMPLYVLLMQQQYPELKASDILLDMPNVTEAQVEMFNEYMENELYSFRNTYEKINFYVRDNSNNVTYTNEDLLSDYVNSDTTPDPQTTWYLTFSRDQKGLFTKTKTSSTSNYVQSNTMTQLMNNMLAEHYTSPLQTYANSSTYQSYQQRHNENDITSNTFYQDMVNFTPVFKTMKDVSFVFEIKEGMIQTPEDLQNQHVETITSSETELYTRYTSQQASFYVITLPLVFLIFLLLPIRKVKESKLAQFFIQRIPLEILALAGLFLLFITLITGYSDSIFPAILYELLENSKIWTMQLFSVEMLQNLFIWMVYITALSASYLLTGMCAVVVRNSFHEGIPNALRRHSLIYRSIRAIWHYVLRIDLHDTSQNRLLVILICNICSVLFIIILPILIIPYAMVLFYFAFRYYRQLQNHYKELQRVVDDVAHGQFKSEITGELGMFNDLKDNLQNISDSFEKAVAQEVRSQHMKTELITNVSHDLKTPLTAIISYLDLLAKADIQDDERNAYLDVLTRSAQRLKHLIEDLFEVSKANSGNAPLNCMQMDIVALMKQVQMECEHTFKSRNLTIRETYSDHRIMLYLDPQKTYRIFENLMMNAGKYAAMDSRVFINIENLGSYVEISMRNVSQDELNFHPDEIMERFTRGDKSRNTEGSGLGLAIARSFVELQGGTMHITIDGDLFKVTIRFMKATQDDQMDQEITEQLQKTA